MSRLLAFAAAATISLAAPSVVLAQTGRNTPGYNQGYQRGQSAGAEDSRRGDRFDFADESDYRNGDWGYRSQYGNRDRYRDSFRYGYQDGYRSGYGNYGTYGPPYGNARGRGYPPYSNGRYNQYDPAYQTGLNDGYEAGLDDGRDNDRFDPISERRYRSADHGYRNEYGPREYYKSSYRDAFRIGYERGYNDGRRYDGRRSGWGGIFGSRF
jgi:flagellar biosynthesis/type III secretory pathway protein FliH